jgi:hypothetical protein
MNQRERLALTDLHDIAVEEAYRMAAMYLDRLIALGENPQARGTTDEHGSHVSFVGGWSRELFHHPDNGEWEVLTVPLRDRGPDPSGLHPHVDELRESPTEDFDAP